MMKLASLSNKKPVYEGKVRSIFEAGEYQLLLVTSERISAYDVVFPEPVPSKGEVLNLLSAYWFEQTRQLIPNHLITTQTSEIFEPGAPEIESLRGRCAMVKRTDPIRYECVVRGHIDGSAWKEYQQTGEVAGYKLPSGLARYDRLPKPIFTPATKAESGHDENITVAQMASEFGEAETKRLKEASLAIYSFAYERLAPKGILLEDTKFEFGYDKDGNLLLIDEVLTPDSSRYRIQESDVSDPSAFDKQFLRDWLAARGFTGDGTPPALDDTVLAELGRRYKAVFQMISGESLEEALGIRG